VIIKYHTLPLSCLYSTLILFVIRPVQHCACSALRPFGIPSVQHSTQQCLAFGLQYVTFAVRHSTIWHSDTDATGRGTELFIVTVSVCCVQVMVGDLPADFLRVTSSAEQRQIAADRQTAAYLQSGGVMPVFAPASRLSVTVAQVNNQPSCKCVLTTGRLFCSYCRLV